MKSLLAILLLGMISQISFAENKPIYDEVLEPSASQQIDSINGILAMVASASNGDKIGNVEIRRHRFSGLQASSGFTKYEFILKFDREFQSDQDICVGIATVFVTHSIEISSIPCDTLAKAQARVDAIRKKNGGLNTPVCLLSEPKAVLMRNK